MIAIYGYKFLIKRIKSQKVEAKVNLSKVTNGFTPMEFMEPGRPIVASSVSFEE